MRRDCDLGHRNGEESWIAEKNDRSVVTSSTTVAPGPVCLDAVEINGAPRVHPRGGQEKVPAAGVVMNFFPARPPPLRFCANLSQSDSKA